MIYPDADLANADWTKQSWDLPINSREELTRWLTRSGMTMEQFTSLPIYQMNRDRLPWLKDRLDYGWFQECPRDESGHCLPKGQADRPAKHEQPAPRQAKAEPPSHESFKTMDPEQQARAKAMLLDKWRGAGSDDERQRVERVLNAIDPHAIEREKQSQQRTATKASLASSPISSSARIKKKGINGSYKVTLADGTTGIRKPSEEEAYSGRIGIERGTAWRREVAVSDVAELLGFADLVPATTSRDEASVQHWVDDATDADDSSNPFDGPEDLARAAALDFIVGNTDRHLSNWMVMTDGKLQLIDNGLSLSQVPESGQAYLEDMALNRRLPVPDIDASKRGELETALKRNGIEDRAIALALQRFDILARNSGREFRHAQLDRLDAEKVVQREHGLEATNVVDPSGSRPRKIETPEGGEQFPQAKKAGFFDKLMHRLRGGTPLQFR